VTTNNGVAETIGYDLNGNLTNIVTATSTNSYQWDAADRLVSATGPTNQSLFTYDGLGRRVQIIEKTNGVAYVTNKFVWDRAQLVEQRDLSGGIVTKRFFGDGEQISGTNYYFTRDHLGSIREMLNSSGVIQARYNYDSYGRLTKISGTIDADFGYAGMYVHQASGLLLTFFRAYSADLGRWLSRDPLTEKVGLNLYAYVSNNPINLTDLLGLLSITCQLSFSGWTTTYGDWQFNGQRPLAHGLLALVDLLYSGEPAADFDALGTAFGLADSAGVDPGGLWVIFWKRDVIKQWKTIYNCHDDCGHKWPKIEKGPAQVTQQAGIPSIWTHPYYEYYTPDGA
jgi:RHS repeat-associated protein